MQLLNFKVQVHSYQQLSIYISKKKKTNGCNENEIYYVSRKLRNKKNFKQIGRFGVRNVIKIKLIYSNLLS